MKHWLVLNKSTLQVVNRYNAELPVNFGGPWGDVKNFIHIECPSELSSKTNLSVTYEVAVVGFDIVPVMENGNPVFKNAYDRSGNLYLSKNGQAMQCQMFEKVPRSELTYVVKEYSA